MGKRDCADGPGDEGVLSLDRDHVRLSDFGPELQLLLISYHPGLGPGMACSFPNAVLMITEKAREAEPHQQVSDLAPFSHEETQRSQFLSWGSPRLHCSPVGLPASSWLCEAGQAATTCHSCSGGQGKKQRTFVMKRLLK